MKAGRAAYLVAMAVAAAAMGAAASAQGSAGADGVAAGVARALLDQARQAAGIGDWAAASDCLAEATARDPGDADILYLRSLAMVKGPSSLDEALGGLDAALATDRFSIYTRRDASMLKAEILVRERRWKDALAALDRTGREPGADPAFRLIRARALIGLGDQESFVSELSSALARFPDDPAFARLFLTRAGRLPSSNEARKLGATILGRLPRYSESDPELPVLAAPLMPDAGSRRDAVLAFRSVGGRSAAATLRALEYGIIDEAAASSELLSGAYPVFLGDLAALYALAGSPKGRDAVLVALSAWKGKIEIDSDVDGITEAFFLVAAGRVSDWGFDPGQDRHDDYRAVFSDGIPREILITRPSLELRIEYSAYPAVDLISFTSGGERRSYSFAPEAFSYAPIAMRPFAGSAASSLLFPYAANLPDPGEPSCAAMSLSVVVQSGKNRSVTVLSAGIPLSSSTYEGNRLVSTASYAGGKPSLERIDLDGDGRFESERRYDPNGASEGGSAPSWLRSDSDGDGVFEYREQSHFPFRKEWDYDGDGNVDALQFQLADGSITREFSSRMDGRLDESIVVRAGKIVSLTRDGALLSFLPDSNPSLTWIGKKSFDLGSKLPSGEGIFSAMGKRYRLIRVGELAFAELLP